MLKRLSIVTLISLLTLAFSAGAFAEEKVYINGIDANYPPHAFMGKSGKPEGFDIEAMDWIAAKMGFKVRHVAMDWNTIIASLLAGKIDMVCSGMSISPERKAVVTFSDPYHSIRKYLVVRDNSKLTRDEILTGNKKLGVQRGTNEAKWLEDEKAKQNWNFTLRYYDSAPLAVQDLVNGRLDGAAIDSAPANDAINKGKKPVKVIGEFAEPDDFGVATRNEDAELREKINKGFELLKQDPLWEQLKDKYGVH